MLNIVLYQPEIPQNTGNIVRTVSATGTCLHLIEPLGFEISDKQLKRAGLDYWNEADIRVYSSYEEFLNTVNNEKIRKSRLLYATTKSKYRYDGIDYTEYEDIYIVFGPESRGLPEDMLREHYEDTVRIPMKEGCRSLNLANSVAVVAYEALRQKAFPFLRTDGNLTT